MPDDVSKAPGPIPAVQHWRPVGPWFFLVLGTLLLVLSVPEFYWLSDPSATDAFSIALAVLLVLIGVSGLRTAVDPQIWLWYAVLTILIVDWTHPSRWPDNARTWRTVVDGLTFAEPFVSAFVYPTLLALILVIVGTSIPSLRPLMAKRLFGRSPERRGEGSEATPSESLEGRSS